MNVRRPGLLRLFRGLPRACVLDSRSDTSKLRVVKLASRAGFFEGFEQFLGSGGLFLVVDLCPNAVGPDTNADHGYYQEQEPEVVAGFGRDGQEHLHFASPRLWTSGSRSGWFPEEHQTDRWVRHSLWSNGRNAPRHAALRIRISRLY